MNINGKRIIQKILAIAIILIMIMADLSFIGESLISYAVEVAKTNHDNISFKSYFLDENELLETTASIDKKDLKVAIELGVKKDGYLSNAKVELTENSNFKFKQEISSEYINSIDENSITFKQINDGENIKVEVGIEFNYKQEADTNYLNKTSIINLSGTYVNSKKDNIQIDGSAELKVNWISSEEIKTVLNTEVITNYIYKKDETNKRIVQLLISSKVENNSYPIKNTNISLNIPVEPQKWTVHKRTTMATNGDKTFNADNCTFVEGILNINVQNDNDNKMIWTKDSKDVFVVTLEYPETTEITNPKITTNSKITTYDDKELLQNAETIISEEKDGILSISLKEEQNEISKGKIYSGEEKEYSTFSEIYVDYANVIQKLEIEEKEVKALKGEVEKEIAVNYKSIEFNKSNISSVLGDTWNIRIKDQSNNVQELTNESETDESGNIIKQFKENARVLYIETTSPVNNGVLKYKTTKSIIGNTYKREDIKALNKIKDSNNITYTKNNDTTYSVMASSEVNLKETESKASIKVEPVTLTTSEPQEMHITAVLETDNEYKDLYKNPVIKIKLPKQINKVDAKCNLMYKNGLEFKNFQVKEENGQEVITIVLAGEQKTYEGEAINGTTLNITANVELNKLATNSSEEIIMNYTNENATSYADNGVEKVKIDIASENSMILTNNIEEYEVTTFGKENDKEILLKSNSPEKNATIRMQVVNNEESDISNIAILGKIVNIDGKIERTSRVRTNTETSKIYYTSGENPTTSINMAENNWKEEDSEDAKYFLIVIGSLEKSKNISFSYDIKIEKNLPNNISTEAFYNVYYTNNLTNTKKEAEATKIVLKTEKGEETTEPDNNKEPETKPIEPETKPTEQEKNINIKADTTAKIQGIEIKPGEEVKAGEIIEYTAVISNDDTNKAENLTITATIPEDTTLVELNPKYPGEDEETGDYSDTEPYYIEKEERQLVKNNATINGKDKIVLKYLVKVKENLSETKIESTKISVIRAEEKITETEFSNKLMPATLLLNLIPIAREAGEVLEPGMGCTYHLYIKNNSGVEQKNITVTVKENELHNIDFIEYHFGNTTKETDNERTFTIDSIMPNESAYVRLQTTIKHITDKTDHAQIAVNVKDSNNVEYRSNLISEEVLGEKLDVQLETTTSSKNKYVKSGDTITYTLKIKNTGKVDVEDVKMEEMISDYLAIDSVKVNGNMVDEYDLNAIFAEEAYSIMTIKDLSIKKSEEYVIEVIGIVSGNILSEEKQLKIMNKALVYTHSGIMAETDINEYYINNSGEYIDDDDDNNNQKGTYTIKGTVWEDKDRDGERDSEELTIEGVRVFAIDVETNEIATNNGNEITSNTGNDGTYSLKNIPKGKYIIGFEYNTEKYMVTIYQADGVSSDRNSDAVKASRIVDAEEITAAYTDSINLTKNISNIDLGLAEARLFSLKLDKVISKMIITNKNGSKTYNFEDTSIAKAEIASKDLSGSNVVIEYKLKVTNVGEVAGYAKTIVDYLPASLTFNSGLNSNWYKKGKNLYTSSLADTIIKPGETKEITLTLTKKMTESNTGLTNNKAEIETAYNSLGIANTTTEKNGEKTNVGSADTIIGVKTGAAVSYVTLTLTIIIAICGLAYLINKKLLFEKIKI